MIQKTWVPQYVSWPKKGPLVKCQTLYFPLPPAHCRSIALVLKGLISFIINKSFYNLFHPQRIFTCVILYYYIWKSILYKLHFGKYCIKMLKCCCNNWPCYKNNCSYQFLWQMQTWKPVFENPVYLAMQTHYLALVKWALKLKKLCCALIRKILSTLDFSFFPGYRDLFFSICLHFIFDPYSSGLKLIYINFGHFLILRHFTIYRLFLDS